MKATIRTKAVGYNSRGFHYIGFVGSSNELNDFLNMLTNYDDGQGRSHDILDEEISDTEYHYQD